MAHLDITASKWGTPPVTDVESEETHCRGGYHECLYCAGE